MSNLLSRKLDAGNLHVQIERRTGTSTGRCAPSDPTPLTARTNNLAEGRTSTLIGHGETGRSGDCSPTELTDRIAFGRSTRVRNRMQARVVRCEMSVPKIIGKPDALIGHVRFERERLP